MIRNFDLGIIRNCDDQELVNNCDLDMISNCCIEVSLFFMFNQYLQLKHSYLGKAFLLQSFQCCFKLMPQKFGNLL